MDAMETTVEELFTSQYRRLVGIARGLLGSEPDAEDAVQDAMLSILRAPHLLAGVERLGSWLYTLVRRRCIDIIRRESRRREIESGLDELWGGADPAQLTAREEFCAAVAHATRELPADLRYAFVENALAEKTFKQMSAESGIPMGTLMARKKKAVARIKSELKKEGFLS